MRFFASKHRLDGKTWPTLICWRRPTRSGTFTNFIPCSKTRRTPFDKANPKAAKSKGKQLHDTYSFWFRRKYNLSPADPRFLELTPEEVETEFWAHYYADMDGKGEEYEDDELDVESLMSKLSDGDEWEDVIND